MTPQPQKLSKRVPKNWSRRTQQLDAEQLAKIHDLFSPVLAEGVILEVAFLYDGAGRLRRVDGLYENGCRVTCKIDRNGDGQVLEEGPTYSFVASATDWTPGIDLEAGE